MSRRAFVRNLEELQSGIEACYESRARLPMLIVLYSAIDVVAWLSNDDPDAKVGKRFMAWVDNYLLKAKPLHCPSADLYAARCGLVHKLTPDSEMSDAKKARLICYSWGNRDADALQALTVRAGMNNDYVCVQMEALYEAWTRGVDLLVREMACDPVREARILGRAGKFFDSDSTEKLDRCIERARGL